MSELRVYRGVGVAAMLALAACGGQVDPNATGETSTRQVGTPNELQNPSPVVVPPSSSSSGGVAPVNAGTCGGVMIGWGDDFEDGTINAGFTVNTPSAFEVDYDDPITGSASLKVEPTRASYIAHKTPNVCSTAIRFAFRGSSDFIASGGNLARIDAGSRRFTISVAPGGAVSILQEVYTTGAAGMAYPPPFGTLQADVPTIVALYVDLANEQLETGLNTNPSRWDTPPVKGPMVPATGGLQTPPAISSIEFGSTPGIDSNPQGLYWIDDIEIL